MKLGSLFDGSGGFPLAGAISGMHPVWASEIEPYPLRVTEARFPNMKQLGDVTKIDGTAIEPVEVITFGSPCQDLSVAGKQVGIHEGERSNLFFEAIRIIKEMREHDRRTGRADEHLRPRFAVWENVPGAFSSNKGADFQAVLQALCEVADTNVSVPLPEKGKWQKAGCIVGDGFSIAWRVYDAQFWGVPQRRKRIYLVADFGSERAGEVLFERESVCRDTAQGREARKGTATIADGSIVAAGFKAGNGAKSRTIGYGREVSPTLAASQSGTNRVPTTVYCLQGNGIDRALTAGCNGKGWRQNECYTLNTIDRPAIVHAIDCRNMNGIDELSGTLQAKNQGGFSLNYINPVAYKTPQDVLYPEITGSLCANSHPGSYTGQDAFSDMLPVIRSNKAERKYIVRRLTPLECCRLQGFPDWWEDNVEGSDSARYKMWGNGIALPCAVDVLGRIAKAQMDER